MVPHPYLARNLLHTPFFRGFVHRGPPNPIAQAERQRQATRPGLAVRGTFSPARAWRPTVVARLAFTLGFTVTIPSEFAEMAQYVFALDGKTTLYIEKMQFFRISVAEVRAREDGQGFGAVATVVPTHGIVSRKKAWSFGAGWQHFHATPSVVTSTYGGWRIHTAQAVMEELVDILKDLPEGGTYLRDFQWKPSEKEKLGKAIGTPGPVATRVLEFLRNH